MPEAIKIGYTTKTLSARLKQLDTTSVPSEFSVSAAFRVNNPEKVEKLVHNQLSEFRIRKSREFFKVSISIAIQKAFPIISEYIDEKSAVAISNSLDDIDELILQLTFHRKNQEVWPQKVTWETGLNRQQAHYRLDILAEKGYLNEKNEWFTLSSKCRKYIFENELQIDTILQSEDFMNP